MVVCYVALCGAVWWRHRRLRRAAASAAAQYAPADANSQPVLIAYASQTGSAEQLAWQTAKSLHDGGTPARVVTINEVSAAMLATTERVLFITSTYGEGDPPDNAGLFAQRLLSARPSTASSSSSSAGTPAEGPDASSGTPDLAALHYGLLALGDSEYQHFCGFGRTLDAWLTAGGATPLFERIDVDRGDESALLRWRQQVGRMAGIGDLPDWQAPAYERWTLRDRRLLNPGSLGEQAWLVTLAPPPPSEQGDARSGGPSGPPVIPVAGNAASLASAPGTGTGTGTGTGNGNGNGTGTDTDTDTRIDIDMDIDIDSDDRWKAGDLVQVLAPADPERPREYSIASIASQGVVELLVRQQRRDDGSLGVASGWLTRDADIGASIDVRLRAHRAFRIEDNRARPLILIGNGTGMAGLRSHLRARDRRAERPNWLLFGERQAAHDLFFRDEIEAWLASGLLSRADFAFSRDQAERIHVQHRLLEAAEPLRRWVDDGSAIYVCGSLQGMASAVDAALVEVLGASTVQRLTEQGRYRRDVY